MRRHPKAIDGAIIAIENKTPIAEKIADVKFAAITTNNSQNQ